MNDIEKEILRDRINAKKFATDKIRDEVQDMINKAKKFRHNNFNTPVLTEEDVIEYNTGKR